MQALENFKILFYFYLFTFDRVNDFNYKYIDLKLYDQSFYNQKSSELNVDNLLLNGFNLKVNNLTRTHQFKKQYAKTSSSPSFTSLDFFDLADMLDVDEFGTKLKSILCNNDLVNNYSDIDDQYNSGTSNLDACLITLVPCGDLNDWHLIDIDQKQAYSIKSEKNNSMLDLTFHGHWELLTNTNDVIERINHVNGYLMQTDVINFMQRKKLGNVGMYARRNKFFSRSKSHFTDSIQLNTCNYLELTIYDSSNSKLVRKQIHRDKFEEIKRNYSKFFNFKKGKFINRQQALDLAHLKLNRLNEDLQTKVNILSKTV